MTTTLDKISALQDAYRKGIALARMARVTSTESPTSSKNAEWAHVEFRNVSNPSSLLLYIRENDPDTIVDNLTSDIKLLEALRISDIKYAPAAILDWVDERYKVLFEEG